MVWRWVDTGFRNLSFLRRFQVSQFVPIRSQKPKRINDLSDKFHETTLNIETGKFNLKLVDTLKRNLNKNKTMD